MVLFVMCCFGELWDCDVLFVMKVVIVVGYILVVELCVCGIDMSFMFVFDFDYGYLKVIGDCVFYCDLCVVMLLVKSLNYGLLFVGMVNCGKYFFGYGFVEVDLYVVLLIDDCMFDVIFE